MPSTELLSDELTPMERFSRGFIEFTPFLILIAGALLGSLMGTLAFAPDLRIIPIGLIAVFLALVILAPEPYRERMRLQEVAQSAESEQAGKLDTEL